MADLSSRQGADLASRQGAELASRQGAELGPHQLDQLEDALDGLDPHGLELLDLAGLELSPALAERLADYQDVLALCREALPLEEPPADALADVIAEAHAVSRRPVARTPEGGRWGRFWERWRGTLIPGVALAGTAAAVLLLLEPERELDRASARLTAEREQAERADQADQADPDTRSEPASEPSVEPRDESGDTSSDDLGRDRVDPDAPATPTAERPAPGGSPSAGVTPPDRRKSSKSGAGASKSELTGDLAPEPAPAPAPMTKDETWTALERANADRRKGDCDRARSRYEQVIAASSDSLALARARAGIGLCLELERRTAEADTWFDQARAGNAGIDAWIASERDEQPLPGASKSKKATSKTAEALEPDGL